MRLYAKGKIIYLEHHKVLVYYLQPFSQAYNLTPYTAYVVCIHFKNRFRKPDFFDKLFHGIFIYSQESSERLLSKMYFFWSISFCWRRLTWGLKHGYNKPKHYLSRFPLPYDNEHYLQYMIISFLFESCSGVYSIIPHYD